MPNLSPEQFEELRRSSDFTGTYKEVPSLSTAVIALNIHKGPLQDPALRRRLAAAINREAMVKGTTGAPPAVARSLIPPGLLGYNPGSGSSGVAQVEPVSDGQKEVSLTVALSLALKTLYGQALDQLNNDLGSVGIHLEFLPIKSREDFLRAQLQASSDLFIGAWVADYPDTHAMVHGILDSREGYAGRFCGSPELDELIEAAQVEIDVATRHSLYRQIEEIVEREVLVLPIFYNQVYRFVRPEVQGLSLSFSLPDVKYEDLWIKG